MRATILLVCIAGLLAGCSFPTAERSEPEGVSFMLNGKVYSNTQVHAVVGQSGFGLSAMDYDGFPELQLGLRPFPGPHDVYPINPFDSTAAASVQLQLDQPSYDTRLFGGQGQIAVTAYNCRTSTGRDPVTGIDGTITLCTIAGTFAFSARSQAGDSVVIANGHFRWTAVRV